MRARSASEPRSAQIALDKARQNLAYTNIYSPIDGVIVERDVDVGQTVAASLSAPQLFLIANDLSQMQILASVDESDIGQVKDDQPVQFTVQSYANETFNGAVKQVRARVGIVAHSQQRPDVARLPQPKQGHRRVGAPLRLAVALALVGCRGRPRVLQFPV